MHKETDGASAAQRGKNPACSATFRSNNLLHPLQIPSAAPGRRCSAGVNICFYATLYV